MTQCVVVVGNPEMGYSIHGPFADESHARDWIDDQTIVEHSVCVMELVASSEGYYRDDEDDEDDED